MNRTYPSIKRGLEQAIRHQKGKRVAGLRLHVPPQVDVKAVRERTGLTQEEFAATFAISLGALRHWERGDRKPRGTRARAPQRDRQGPGRGAAGRGEGLSASISPGSELSRTVQNCMSTEGGQP
jgi:putative transcriptional regulator